MAERSGYSSSCSKNCAAFDRLTLNNNNNNNNNNHNNNNNNNNGNFICVLNVQL